MNTTHHEVFICQDNWPWTEDDNALDLSEFLRVDSTHPDMSPLPITLTSNQEPQFEPFVPVPHSESEEIPFEPLSQPSVEERERPLAKSIITKNVCFNICMKTIRVVQKNQYPAKLAEICAAHGLEVQKFQRSMVSEKNSFSGPKALRMYVERGNATSETFREFMLWFLREKYLRHCLMGEMINKEAYITYKNEVILPIIA